MYLPVFVAILACSDFHTGPEIKACRDTKVQTRSVEEVVDVIELHHGYDFQGRLAFRQLIFYRWSSYHRRFQIVDTVVVTSESMCPRKSNSGFYLCRWKDEEGQRIVKSLSFRNSRSQTDPEVAERKFLPTHLRAGLKRSPKASVKSNNDEIRVSNRPPRPEPILKF